MSNLIDRRIEVNVWLIKARWYYMTGIAFIGIISKSFGEYKLPSDIILNAFIIGTGFNIFNFLIFQILKRTKATWLVNFLSYWQVGFELVFFTFIFYYAGGLESVSPLFFFLPIISAGFFFGSSKAIITALLSGAAVTMTVFFEYLNIFPHMFLYKVRILEYSDFDIAMTNLISYSIFYLVIGIYAGHISNQLIGRSEQLYKQTQKLEKESNYRKNEWQQLDMTAKLLVKRDKELVNANRELDKKVKELQRSEAAMLKAFSDLKEGKLALENERNRTRAIIENIIDPIIVINKNNKLELLNQSAMKIFGLNTTDLGTEIDSKNNYSLNNFKKIADGEFEIKKIKGEQDDDVEEMSIVIAGQETTYKIISASVIDKNGKKLGIMKIFYNLTRERMLDKLKSEFISIAAHQLRTPLSAIKWVIKMVLDGDAGELKKEQEELLMKGYKSNERIITLVNDMLNVSRIEDGRFGYVLKKDDLKKAIKGSLESLRELIEKKNIKLTLDLPEQMPLLNMDVKKISLMLQGLLENAIKYTPERGKISVNGEVGKRFVKVRVRDNGIGIPNKDKEKIFSKFFRAENALRLQTEGSGLGLFIVKNIIKAHGGNVSFNSEEGMGTEFIFTLPIDYHPDKSVG